MGRVDNRKRRKFKPFRRLGPAQGPLTRKRRLYRAGPNAAQTQRVEPARRSFSAGGDNARHPSSMTRQEFLPVTDPIAARNSWRLRLGAWLAICALTLLAYGPALRAGFIWDDDAHVTAPGLRSLHGLGQIWLRVGATQQYYPVLHSWFWLEQRLWGDAALGYHLADVLLHATAAWLFALVLRRLAIPGAWLAGLIFALHPVGVESAAWISEQKNTLSAVGYFLAALAYWEFDDRRGRAAACWWAGATALFALALLSKTVTATLPAALLVVGWGGRGRLSWRRDVLPLMPWLGMGVAAGLFSAWVERRYVGAQGTDFALSAVQRCLLAGRAIWFYLGKLVWPADLIFIYPHWKLDPARAWDYCFPAAAVALTVLLWGWRRRSRGPLAAWLFFVGSLFPALGFFNVYPFVFSYVADHFQYLASCGVISAGAAGAVLGLRQVSPGLRAAGWGAILALLATLGGLSWAQSRSYRDAPTLYRAILQRNPDCWLAHNNLGLWYEEQGDSARAIAEYQKTLWLKPDSAGGHFNLGCAWAQFPERRNDALAEYREALRLNPAHAEAHNNLGLLLASRPEGRAEAVREFTAALRVRPGYAEAHNNLANTFLQMPGRLDDAIANYRAALRENPRYAAAHFNLAIALLNRPGRTEEAEAELREFMRLEPGNPAGLRLQSAIRLQRLRAP